MRRMFLLLLLISAPPTLAADPCDPCQMPGGSYRSVTPPGWNGHDPLRLLLFLHGWQGTGSDIASDPNIAGVANRRGFLLIAPDGEGRSWGHVGSPHQGRDDVAFLLSVLDDAERRWPIDRRAVVAGGFSQGGSMVWDLACYAAPRFTAFIPFSGGFWEPLPKACAAGAVNLRHTHGMHDTVVPLHGRPLFGPYRQGDIMQGFAVWKAEDRCRALPDRTAREGDLTCSFWTSCGSGHELTMCMQGGNHSMIAPWLDASLAWAVSVSAKSLASAP
jgi:polyhydroxybutyrate depolymerase